MNNIVDIPSIEIMTPKEGDLNDIADLVNDCWHMQYDDHLSSELASQRTPQLFQQQLRRNLQQASIARISKKIVAYADHVSNCIDNLWVNPDYQRRHIASRLLEHQLQQLRQRKFSSAQAGTESFNTASIEFFESHGWQLTDKVPQQLDKDLIITTLVYTCRL